METALQLLRTGPDFSRLLPIEPCAKGGPALLLPTYASWLFQSKLLVWCWRWARDIF